MAAKVKESFAILQIGERPEAHVPFPDVHDWDSLRITLSRSGCYGACSSYEIEIHGDGTVLYDGHAYVGTAGKKELRISHASLVQLVDTFRKVDYFSLADGYVSGVTDNPTYVTFISFDGVSKSVLDYVGREAGMPHGVSDVEVAIDQVSGASKSIGGAPDVMPLDVRATRRFGSLAVQSAATVNSLIKFDFDAIRGSEQLRVLFDLVLGRGVGTHLRSADKNGLDVKLELDVDVKLRLDI